jgi:iron complex outermembrane receptor protein
VERIEIIRGGHSVLHPFAIGGVINIVTKKGRQTDKIKPEIKVKSGYGSFDTYFGAVSVNGGASKYVGYNFSYSTGETDGYLRNNFQDSQHISGHLTFYLAKGARLNLGIKHSTVKYGFPVLNDPSRSDYDSDYPTFLGTADQLRHSPPNTQLAGPHTPYWNRDVTYLDAIFTLPLSNGEIKVHGFSTEGKRWMYFSPSTAT